MGAIEKGRIAHDDVGGGILQPHASACNRVEQVNTDDGRALLESIRVKIFARACDLRRVDLEQRRPQVRGAVQYHEPHRSRCGARIDQQAIGSGGDGRCQQHGVRAGAVAAPCLPQA